LADLRTIKFNVQKFYVLLTQRISDLKGSQKNKDYFLIQH